MVPVDGDTYMIAKRSAEAGFGPPVKTQASVYAEANEYCEKRQNKVETVDLIVRNSGFGKPGSVNLKFRCIDSDTATIAGTPSGEVQSAESGVAEPNRDKYADLERLKKLLDDGALTQEEYDIEKAKILSD